MAMFTIARENYVCPRCKAKKGDPCRTPKGRKASQPHTERTALLTDKERESCKKIGSFNAAKRFASDPFGWGRLKPGRW
jgi:hypothetical protein